MGKSIELGFKKRSPWEPRIKLFGHIYCKGMGNPARPFCSNATPKIKQVTLKNALSSYKELACSECYDWPLSSMLPNVLDSFDLPECYAQLGGKLKLIDPAGAMLNPVTK